MKKSPAVRGAYQLAAAAVRAEVKKLSKLSKSGVAQHATLSSIAEQLGLLAVSDGEAPDNLFELPRKVKP
jgi:hypothetical protein